MKKTPAFYLFATVFCLLMPLIAQANEIIRANLTEKFGQISCRDLENSYEFTFSLDFSDIEYALNMANSNDMFVNFASVAAREDGKAAILIRVSSTRNDASRKFAMFTNFLRPGMVTWKKGAVPPNMAVVTSVETDFGNTITLQGMTLKSSLIFSHLFPMIERTNELKSPFFSRGSYSDTESGRVMDFTVICQW
ncbi:MAG: hypothetical protein KKB51_04535 [Candidatus Riflebacteria bacterium]|nr:hypothetical protein [Candidatus Riflebacteria bacterium]